MTCLWLLTAVQSFHCEKKCASTCFSNNVCTTNFSDNLKFKKIHFNTYFSFKKYCYPISDWKSLLKKRTLFVFTSFRVCSNFSIKNNCVCKIIKKIYSIYNGKPTDNKHFSRGTFTVYWQWRTFGNKRGISKAIHCLALRSPVFRYHVITGRMCSFTLYLHNPALSTAIVLSHDSWNARVDASGSAITRCLVFAEPVYFSCNVALLANAFLRFEAFDNLTS